MGSVETMDADAADWPLDGMRNRAEISQLLSSGHVTLIKSPSSHKRLDWYLWLVFVFSAATCFRFDGFAGCQFPVWLYDIFLTFFFVDIFRLSWWELVRSWVGWRSGAFMGAECGMRMIPVSRWQTSIGIRLGLFFCRHKWRLYENIVCLFANTDGRRWKAMEVLECVSWMHYSSGIIIKMRDAARDWSNIGCCWLGR